MSKSRYEVVRFLIVMVYLQIRLTMLRVAVKVFPNSQRLLEDLEAAREKLTGVRGL
jgi:hypothetical protein